MSDTPPESCGVEQSDRGEGAATTRASDRAEASDRSRASVRAGQWWIAAAAVVGLAVVAAVVVARQGGDTERGPVSVAPAASAPQRASSASAPQSPSPDDGPPYVAVPTFATASVRDTAFVADVAQFSTWPIGVEGYDVMSSSPGGSDISDFRAAVVKDAKAVCGTLTDGTDMEDVPDTVGLELSDPIDQAAFIVEAVTFYCPDQMAAVTDDVYSEPVPTRQTDDCPTATALEMKASIGERSDDDTFHSASYTVQVHNTSSYAVRVLLEQRWFADGYADDGVWGLFGDAGDEEIVTIEAGDTFTYEGEQEGIYRWDRTEVRAQSGQFVFFGCGYRPGPGPGTDAATGS